ncbi:O-antigen ligase family protein [Pseudarthrobacter sp. C1]|uniref:O-antigen ligase family protein n=1 Tax=Pseudarthrobacter sp. C1 TaxID=3108940 RepID=UPI002B0594E2|nr:O-antigen ligase family protein [Pseudarthrobacter sp. C1]MEA3550240.1 O-antigen ligase family protein [Pseudarthrobacter sp. C1]
MISAPAIRLATAHTGRSPLPPIAGSAAALIAFLAAWEPNAALRYGPFIAVAAFLLGRPLRFRIGLTEWALVLFMLWALLSSVWTQHPDVFVAQMIIYSSLAIMFIGVRAACRWGQNEALAVGGYVIGCLYGLALTSFQLIAGYGEIYRDSLGRITQVGTLNINYVAYTAVTAIVLLLLALQSNQLQSRRMRLLAIAAVVILVIGSMSTQTRGVQVSTALLGVWLIIARFGRPAKVITGLCVLAIVGVSFGWVDPMLERIDIGDRSIAGLSGRLPLWESARAVWQESLLTGAGLGADRAQNAENLATHNTILGIGVTLGIIGLALFLAFAVSAVNDRIQDLDAPTQRFRMITIIIAFTPILLTSPWEGTASGWVGLALLSTPVLAAPRSSSTMTEYLPANI